jgi:hypothetical protein
MNLQAHLLWLLVPLLCFWLVSIGFSVRLFRRLSRGEKLTASLFDVISFVLVLALMSQSLVIKIIACIIWLLAGYLCVPLLQRLSAYEKAAILALDSSLALTMGICFATMGISEEIRIGWSLVLVALSSASVVLFWLGYCRDRGIR